MLKRENTQTDEPSFLTFAKEEKWLLLEPGF